MLFKQPERGPAMLRKAHSVESAHHTSACISVTRYRKKGALLVNQYGRASNATSNHELGDVSIADE